MTYSVVELEKKYTGGSLTPKQVIDDCLDSIEAMDSVVGAWQAVYAEEARAAAEIAPAEIASGTR